MNPPRPTGSGFFGLGGVPAPPCDHSSGTIPLHLPGGVSQMRNENFGADTGRATWLPAQGVRGRGHTCPSLQLQPANRSRPFVVRVNPQVATD